MWLRGTGNSTTRWRKQHAEQRRGAERLVESVRRWQRIQEAGVSLKKRWGKESGSKKNSERSVCVCVCVCDRTAKTYRLLCSSIGITRRQKSGQVYTRLRALRPTRGMLRDTAKQRKAPKRKLRCPLVVSCSFVSLFHLLLCVLLKRQKRMAEEKEKEPSKKERVPLAATSTLWRRRLFLFSNPLSWLCSRCNGPSFLSIYWKKSSRWKKKKAHWDVHPSAQINGS